MKISMTAFSEILRARLYIYKKQKNTKCFYIQKPGHFSKSKIIPVTFLYTKSMKLYDTRFYEIFDVGIYIQKL